MTTVQHRATAPSINHALEAWAGQCCGWTRRLFGGTDPVAEKHEVCKPNSNNSRAIGGVWTGVLGRAFPQFFGLPAHLMRCWCQPVLRRTLARTCLRVPLGGVHSRSKPVTQGGDCTKIGLVRLNVSHYKLLKNMQKIELWFRSQPLLETFDHF